MNLPSGTAVYIHASIPLGLDLAPEKFCIQTDYDSFFAKRNGAIVPFWHVKTKDGWFLLEIHMRRKKRMTQKRAEFFLALAQAIDWSQHYSLKERVRII